LEVLIDTTVSIIEENKQETMPLAESTRGTLDESNVTTPEEKQEVEPKAPTVTQELVGGSPGERPTHSQNYKEKNMKHKRFHQEILMEMTQLMHQT
jgi:hypothetical protein